MTKIIFCGCQTGSASVFQDKKYGEGQRVFNRGEKDGTYSCTCCGKAKSEYVPKGKK